MRRTGGLRAQQGHIGRYHLNCGECLDNESISSAANRRDRPRVMTAQWDFWSGADCKSEAHREPCSTGRGGPRAVLYRADQVMLH